MKLLTVQHVGPNLSAPSMLRSVRVGFFTCTLTGGEGKDFRDDGGEKSPCCGRAAGLESSQPTLEQEGRGPQGDHLQENGADGVPDTLAVL